MYYFVIEMGHFMKIYSQEEIRKQIICLLTGIPFGKNQKYIENKQNINILLDDFFNINKETISVLSQKETYILRKKYGVLDDGKVQTLDKIGKEFKITNERIRQILMNITKKLRKEIDKPNDILNDYKESNSISNLLDLKLIYIFDYDIVKKLYQEFNDEMTLRELVHKSSLQVKNVKELEQNEFEQIEIKLSKLNLSFNDCISICKNRISMTDIAKDLTYKLEADESYYVYINDIVREMCNLNLRQIFGFNEETTGILRKIYGVLDHGIKPSIEDIHKYMNTNNNTWCSNKIIKAFDDLNNIFKCFLLGEAIKMSNEKMLQMDIKYFNLDNASYINLKKGGINTLEKLIELVYNDNLDIKYPYDRALIERIVKRIVYIYKINDNSEKERTLKKSFK